MKPETMAQLSSSCPCSPSRVPSRSDSSEIPRCRKIRWTDLFGATTIDLTLPRLANVW